MLQNHGNEECSKVAPSSPLRLLKFRTGARPAFKTRLRHYQDDAHDQFAKTFNAAFVQERSSRNLARRSQAPAGLGAAAKKARDPRLRGCKIAAVAPL